MKKTDKFMSTLKVGPKGQIVIPKEVREMFAIEPGDSLVIMADRRRGIALARQSFLSRVADAVFSGRLEGDFPEYSEAPSTDFATAIKSMEEE